MIKSSIALVALVLFFGYAESSAQSRFSSIRLDNGSGHTLTLQLPGSPTWAGDLTLSLPIPPVSGLAAGFVNRGAGIPNELLTWLPPGGSYTNTLGTVYSGGTDGAWVPKTPGELGGLVRVSTSSSYTIGRADGIIGVNTSNSAVNLTLPQANSVSVGKIVIVKNEVGDPSVPGHTITISAQGTDKLNGVIGGSVAITFAGGSYQFYSDGSSNWFSY